MEFSREEYWSRVPFPTPRDLPNPEIEPEKVVILLSINLKLIRGIVWVPKILY